MLYNDIYALIVPHLSTETIPTFVSSCATLREIFWDSIDVTADDYLPLRRAVMRGAAESLKLMLERRQGEIPAAVLKLALLTSNSDVVQLLLQYEVEVDDVCLCFALQLCNVELFKGLLAKAKRPILHCTHIFNFWNDDREGAGERRKKLTKIVRSSPQFRTLLVPDNFRLWDTMGHFLEFNLYRRDDAITTLAGAGNCFHLGIDPELSEEERRARVREIKREIEANWPVSDRKPFALVGSGPPSPQYTLNLDGDTQLLRAVWLHDELGARKIALEEGDKLEEQDRVYCFRQANERIRAMFLEIGFVSLTPEIVGIMYVSSQLDLLRPLWLAGKALVTPAMLDRYHQSVWFRDIAETVYRYWNDVEISK